MAGRAATLVIGLALVLAASGCAGTVVGDGPVGSQRSSGALTVHSRWESCAAATPADGSDGDGGQDALALPRMDEGFEPVAAVVCRAGPQQRPSGGLDLVAVEDRADDVTALVNALRLPDDKPTEGACTLDLPFVPWLALLDGKGRWVRPGVPIDACRKPRHEFRTAYEQLRTKRVTTRVLREIESDKAAASGCSQAWADMVWVAGQSGGHQDNTPGPLPADETQVGVCVYRVPPSEQGSGKPAGTFQSGGRLTAGRWAAVKRVLTGAGVASACTTPSSRFAVLHLPAGLIYVEADGCRRVLIEGGTGSGVMRQGTAELTSLLFDQ
ncbi:hypothetical protein AB0M36_07870 [Actinoplanes sp. NPDC051346]|uniref:hypothetical protein n=1 Tax=Actinoplanes sp. NPDC051346 TaxID=3155048 RepID=UPI00343098EB